MYVPWPTVKQVEWAVQLAERHGRKVATADEARQIMKVGVYYDSVEDTLTRLGFLLPAGYSPDGDKQSNPEEPNSTLGAA